MEDILPIILGVPFGLAVFALAFFDAGKLPGGPQPENPARPTQYPAPIVTIESPERSLNGTEELDAEEKATIRRVVEIRDRVEARRSALSQMGLEITNSDKW